MFQKKVLVLALAGLIAAPAWALDDEALRQEMRRLADRVSQLEAANAKLQAALAKPDEAALATRVEDVENAVVALRDKPGGLPAIDGVSAGAALVMVAQQASGAANEHTQLSVRADVEVELPMGTLGDAPGKLFAHLRAGAGDGVDAGSFATPNATVFGDINSPILMQAWYQADIPVGGASGNLGQVEVTLGKIDPFGFFDGNNIADDESEGFMNLAFVHNPLLDAGGDIGVGEHGASPGLRLAYVSDVNGGNHVTASVAYFGAGDDGANYVDSFEDGLAIGQLEYAGKALAGLEGTYRLYAWSNGRDWDMVNAQDENVDDGLGNDDGSCDPGEVCDVPTLRERHTGWGLSFDQQVSDHATLFARYGHSTSGNLSFDHAWTLGAQVVGTVWGREDDRLGLAYGQLHTRSGYKLAQGVTGDESMLELFYAVQLNDNLSLTPDVQWISNPGGDKTADDVTVWGLRAKASF